MYYNKQESKTFKMEGLWTEDISQYFKNLQLVGKQRKNVQTIKVTHTVNLAAKTEKRADGRRRRGWSGNSITACALQYSDAQELSCTMTGFSLVELGSLIS